MAKMRHGGRKKGELIRTMGLVSMMTQAIMTFVVGTVGGLFLGRFLDREFGTEPFLLLVCVMLGFGAGIYSVIWALHKAEKRQSADRQE